VSSAITEKRRNDHVTSYENTPSQENRTAPRRQSDTTKTEIGKRQRRSLLAKPIQTTGRGKMKTRFGGHRKNLETPSKALETKIKTPLFGEMVQRLPEFCQEVVSPIPRSRHRSRN